MSVASSGEVDAAKHPVHTVDVTVETSPLLELPRLSEYGPVATSSPQAAPIDPGGEPSVARPDGERSGRGGSLHAQAPAINLADRDDGVLLSQEVASRTDRNQVQRARDSTVRSSNEDRRSLRDPMELVFFAEGTGQVRESRSYASRDPAQGATRSGPAEVLGGPTDPDRADLDASASRVVRLSARGSRRSSPGLGLLRSQPGADHRVSANVASGRPMVARGAFAVPAARTGPVRDLTDSQQEVASAVQSIVHASTAGGVVGEGPGGEPGPGPTGAGGLEGPGSHALPAGRGFGRDPSYDELDPRISAYRRMVLAKIAPLWENAFPKWAALEGRQGHAIISFVIRADGSIDQVGVARSSGIL